MRVCPKCKKVFEKDLKFCTSCGSKPETYVKTETNWVSLKEFLKPHWRRILIILIAASLLVLAWSPWITKSYAENKVVSTFKESQKDITDGCGFNCVGCGVTNSNKVPFGYSVDIEYGCGMRPPDARHLNEEDTYFVSFFGISMRMSKS